MEWESGIVLLWLSTHTLRIARNKWEVSQETLELSQKRNNMVLLTKTSDCLIVTFTDRLGLFWQSSDQAVFIQFK